MKHEINLTSCFVLRSRTTLVCFLRYTFEGCAVGFDIHEETGFSVTLHVSVVFWVIGLGAAGNRSFPVTITSIACHRLALLYFNIARHRLPPPIHTLCMDLSVVGVLIFISRCKEGIRYTRLERLEEVSRGGR